jgi:UDP-N-acetylglucosamine--N-acetylmuramyl-(pentapeptide) pyrophosphoryl-undecaprenol N-acetylglucosamine transferase
MRAIISGGGTGGHIFPAISIANALKAKQQDVEILFVGAEGRMEMEKVPEAGYNIEGLPIAGFQRKMSLKNLSLPFKIIASLNKANKIVKSFQPDICIGVGGYASGPLLRIAQKRNIPTLIQEQNSYAGMTNKMLSKNARLICVAYDRMERFFPSNKIVLTGNPVRKVIIDADISKTEARVSFGLDPNKKTLLVFGGSLGARTLNEGIASKVELLKQREDIQVLWQVGKNNYANYSQSEAARLSNVVCSEFIKKMENAYAAADLVVCRAGALTISELCVAGKAAILVPSPYVAEDHQTENANALVRSHAAKLIKDSEAADVLLQEAYDLLDQPSNIKRLEKEIKTLGKPDAIDHIVDKIMEV